MIKKLIKIQKFPEYLRSRIIGQDHVINAFCEKIKYGERGIANPNRPKGCFFLLGPTGVGKTELVRETVKYFFGDLDKRLLRIDMSEIGETAGSDVGKKLLGSGPNDPGRLYNFLETSSCGAILYDEFEKAHRDIAKYMLQQLDAARVTLFNNKTYDLSKYYLFFTSNIGASIFQGNAHLTMTRKVEVAVNQLRQHFQSPEFVARFGAFDYGILAFKSLEISHLRKITQKFINDELIRFRTIKETSSEHPDNMIIKGYSLDFVDEILMNTDTTKNGAREVRDITERMLYRTYDETFTITAIGHDVEGYIDIRDHSPVVVYEKPENGIEIE